MEKVFVTNEMMTLWLLFCLLSAVGAALLLWWAMRSGQFSSPRRSARLPLEGWGQPRKGERRRPGRREHTEERRDVSS